MTTKMDEKNSASLPNQQLLLNLDEEVLPLVEKQYDLTVAFCNAQTSLLNAAAPEATTTPRKRHLLLDEYVRSSSQLQTHWRKLQAMDQQIHHLPTHRRVAQVFHAHVQRTQRVLMTVQRGGGGVWTSHGLSLSRNDAAMVTVALATLRASVDEVREVLSLSIST